MRKLLFSLMKILSVTNLYFKMPNLLVIKAVLPLPPAVQRNVKLLEMEKVKKKKKVGKYDEPEWQKDPPVGEMKKQQFIGTPGI